MNHLRSALFLVSTCFLFIDAQAAAYAKPTVSTYVRSMAPNAPSTTTRVLLKSALNNAYIAQAQYHTSVKELERRRTTRTSTRISVLATRVHIPVTELPSVVRARDLYRSHADDIALICNDAELPFETLQEYYAIAEKVHSSPNILSAFFEDSDGDFDQYEGNFIQFIEFLIEICPDALNELKKALQGRIVLQEPEAVQEPSHNTGFSCTISSDGVLLFDLSGEFNLSSDDESDAAEAIRTEAAKSYQEAVARMLREQDEALRAREQLYEREPVAS